MMLDTSVLRKPRLRQFVMIIGYLPSMYIMLPKLISTSDPHRLIVPFSEMTYTVSSGTLNSTIPYHTIPYHTMLFSFNSLRADMWTPTAYEQLKIDSLQQNFPPVSKIEKSVHIMSPINL